MTRTAQQAADAGDVNERSGVGVLARLARWGAAHPRRTVAAWVALLAVAVGVSMAVGSAYSDDNSLGGTESQRATDLLARDFPGEAGDSDQIVLHVRAGSVTGPAVQARVKPMLAAVARLPHVSGVVSPFGDEGAGAVSRDGRTAFATVNFDERANDLPVSAIERVIATAKAARSPALEVELGGQAIAQTQGASLGFATVVALLAALLVLLLTFGSLVAAGLPIVTALLGVGTAFGLIGLASQLIKMPPDSTELAAMIGLGVGIDYALFVVTRFRESARGGSDVHAAIAEAMNTAGRAVLLAGLTVIVALLGMLALGVGFLNGLAISSSIAVLLTMLATLTLLPALLGAFGSRIARGRRSARPRRAPATAGGPASRTSLWLRWGALVRRRPWAAAIAGTAIMLVIATPALSMRLGLGDAGNDPAGTTTRKAYDMLAEGFGKGFNGPLLIVARLPRSDDQLALRQLRTTLRRTRDVASVAPARLSRDGRTAVFQTFPRSAPQASATTDLVQTLRSDVLPPLQRATGATLLVGGATAVGIDFADVLQSKLPLFVAIVVLLAAAMLLVMFRSVAIPLQAAIMNLLSIGAAFGVTVAVFQHGWLGGLLGVSPGPIEPWLPVILFAIVFGLSMDYEVFLVSRIHERWRQTGDPSQSVVDALGSTGRVITAAATIMICVFVSFVFGSERVLKLFGLSLASAVFLDAFVIRSLLLPAVLELLGRRTWQLPRWLNRRLPTVQLHGPSEPAPEHA
jgi:putative drug exporter of the RND superfamily